MTQPVAILSLGQIGGIWWDLVAALLSRLFHTTYILWSLWSNAKHEMSKKRENLRNFESSFFWVSGWLLHPASRKLLDTV